MTDIIEKLRRYAGNVWLSTQTELDAANEIERLRAEKEHYIEAWSDVCNENQGLRNELDALKKDAMRYQFIRSGGAYIEPHENGEIYVATDVSAQYYTDVREIDIAIDGAIAEQKS